MRKMVKIKGAGLSGLAAAIYLAQQSFDVEVSDARPSIGSFFDVDVHSFRNYGFGRNYKDYLSLLGVELANSLPLKDFYYVAPNGKSFKITSKSPIFTNVVRGKREGSLDASLQKRAEELGVRLRFGSGQTERADIVATGSAHGDIHGYGKHYMNVNIESEYIFLDDDIAPKGYIYLSPCAGSEASLVIVSCSHSSDIKKSFGAVLNKNELIQKILSGATEVCEISGSASYGVPVTACVEGSLYVGECAGFMDAGRGFGMYYAIASGYLAGKAIAKGLDYDKLWKKEFGKELFERFARRQYMNTLTNEDHNRMVEETIKKYGTEIPIEVYEKRKKKSWYKKAALNLYARYKLIGWRKSHPLK